MARLVGKRLAFVEHIAQGKSCSEAARAAGYSERHARGRAYQLMENPEIKAAVAEIQERVKQKAQYGVEQAVIEVDGLLQQARDLKQMTAAAKLFDTKAKLYGLLVDRVAVELPSIGAAIEIARARAGLPSRIAGSVPPIIDSTATEVPSPSLSVPAHDNPFGE